MTRSTVLATALAAVAVAAACDPTTSPDVLEDCTDVRLLPEDGSIPRTAIEAVLNDPAGYIQPGNDLFPTGKLVVIRIATLDSPVNPSLDDAWVREVFFDDVDKSVAALFRENSLGRFTVSEGQVAPWTELEVTTASLGGIEGSGPFMQVLLTFAEVDWGALDTNGDSVISRAEAQIVLLPVFGSWASTRGPDIGEVDTPSGRFDFGTRPIIYRTVPSTGPAGPDPVYSHELGHAFFGAPDRRDTLGTYPRGWEMMSHGREWTHFHVYDKIKLGWVRPTFLARHLGECVRFPPIELQDAALVLFRPAAWTDGEIDPSQYWIVEYRNKQRSAAAVEDALPDDGLLVWHVRRGTWGNGYDEIRLVDEQQPGRTAMSYAPGRDAAFESFPDSYSLISADGGFSGLYFGNVTGLDALIGAEF